MTHWVPTYEERRFTEQKCLAAIKDAKDGGRQISVADIENRPPFSRILDPDESKRTLWAEEFANQHSWVPIMVYGSEKRVRVQKHDDNWTELFQHNLDATTAYLDEVKPEIPYGTHYSRQVLLRDALSAATHEIIPIHMRKKAFQQASDLHSLRNKSFPGKPKRLVKLYRIAIVFTLLVALNLIIVQSNPFRISPVPQPLPHLQASSDPLPLDDPAYAAALLAQSLDAADTIHNEENRAEVLVAIAHRAGELKDAARSTAVLEQTLAVMERIEEEGLRAKVVAAVGQGAGTLKDTAQGRPLLKQTLAAAEKIRSEPGRSEALLGVAQAAWQMQDVDQTLSVAKQITDADVQSRSAALALIARGAVALEDTARGKALLKQIMDSTDKLGLEGWQAEVLAVIAQGAGKMKDTAHGRALLKETFAKAEGLGDHVWRAKALAGVAQGAGELTDREQGYLLLKQTLTAAERISNTISFYDVLVGIAQGAGELKDTQRSKAILEQTIAAAAKIEEEDRHANALTMIATQAASLKDTTQGSALLAETLVATDKIQTEEYRAAAIGGIAQQMGELRDTARAFALLEMAVAAAHKIPRESEYQEKALIGAARGYAAFGRHATTAAALETMLAAAEKQGDLNRAETLAGIAQGAATLRDSARGEALLKKVLVAAETINHSIGRSDALAGIAQGAVALKDPAQGWVLLEQTLAAAEKLRVPIDRNHALTAIIENTPPSILLRQMERNPDPKIRRRIAEDFQVMLDKATRGGKDTHRGIDWLIQVTPSVRREAFDENADVRTAVESLADIAAIPLPNSVERLAGQEITFAGIQSSDIFCLLLLLPEFAVLMGLNAIGGAIGRKDGRRLQTAKLPKIADSNILLRAAGYSNPAVRELLQAVSLKTQDLERVMPERLSHALDIRLQGILVAACASPEAAVPLLTALENRWEALHPEIREGDVRQQAKALNAMLQVIVERGDTTGQADARRCLTRLNHFLDVPTSEFLQQGSAPRAEAVPTHSTQTTPTDGSIEAQSPEKREAASPLRIQEQYGSQKQDDAISRQL